MPEKLKLKCTACGTWFKAVNYKRTLCPVCFEKAERARAASRRQAAVAGKGGGVTVTPPKAPPSAPAVAARADQTARSTGIAPDAPPVLPAMAPVGGLTAQSGDSARAARQPADAPPARLPDPAATDPTPVRVAQPRLRESPLPTPEQIAAIEQRYAELCTPHEFDGIRAQIATELDLPRPVVKRVVKAFRERQRLPSWWDLAHHAVQPDDLARIQERYQPLLPLPPVGVHRDIAAELGLHPLTVYGAIGEIRRRLGMARFNDRDDLPERPAQPAEPGQAVRGA